MNLNRRMVSGLSAPDERSIHTSSTHQQPPTPPMQAKVASHIFFTENHNSTPPGPFPNNKGST